jgi:hypothetical protein
MVSIKAIYSLLQLESQEDKDRGVHGIEADPGRITPAQIGILTFAADVFITSCSRCIRLTGAYNNGGIWDGKCRRLLIFCLIVLR